MPFDDVFLGFSVSALLVEGCLDLPVGTHPEKNRIMDDGRTFSNLRMVLFALVTVLLCFTIA
jgi:hypothetical protein